MKYFLYLLLLIGSTGAAQTVTIEGHASDSTNGFYVIEIVVNDTLAKVMASPKEGRAKYLRMYQNPKYVVRTDSTGKFRIKADRRDSLYFKSYEHKTQAYLVDDLIKQKSINVLLSPKKPASSNGDLLSKELVDLSTLPIWDRLSLDGKLKTENKHLELLNFYIISYVSDSLVVKGILVEPKENGSYPVVIFNRGGNRGFGALTIGSMMKYTAKLAAEGYVVLASNYRTTDEFGGADINDVLALTETVKEIDNADPTRIGLFGWSRGGMMTYLALQKSDRFKTAVVGNGPTNLFDLIADRPEMETEVLAQCVPNYYANKNSELEKRSVVYWADQLNKASSLLILSATKDERVNPNQADQLAKKLTAIDYDFKLVKMATDHVFTGKEAELEAILIEWFAKHLKGTQ